LARRAEAVRSICAALDLMAGARRRRFSVGARVSRLLEEKRSSTRTRATAECANDARAAAGDSWNDVNGAKWRARMCGSTNDEAREDDFPPIQVAF
jgi:hypothetical protein